MACRMEMLSVRKNVTVADTSCIVSGRIEE
jgi:uncharacterized protein YacL